MPFFIVIFLTNLKFLSYFKIPSSVSINTIELSIGFLINPKQLPLYSFSVVHLSSLIFNLYIPPPNLLLSIFGEPDENNKFWLNDCISSITN